MSSSSSGLKVWMVALLAEGVDRNNSRTIKAQRGKHVALLAEGVDRNPDVVSMGESSVVALLAEGVDRNLRGCLNPAVQARRSPSSRRAWIEISQRPRHFRNGIVALLAEGVDRNASSLKLHIMGVVALLAEGVDRNSRQWSLPHQSGSSPSSRRAWIEISGCTSRTGNSGGRPPRGGRG